MYKDIYKADLFSAIKLVQLSSSFFTFLHFFFTFPLILLTNLWQKNIILLVPVGTSFFIYLT